MNKPKVSIVIPVYNGSNYLANAIESALNQSYENKEIIVINDGSTDDGKTEQIALSYGDKIRYHRKKNGGVSSALNCGIQMMTGEYFSWLSHDDAYAPDKLTDAVELLERNDMLNQKVICFTGGYFIDTAGEKIKDFLVYFEKERLYSGREAMGIMTQRGTLNGCCMLIPRRAFEDAGYFDETLRYSQDALMWYKMFLAGYGMISDNKPNVMYRLHGNQTSQLRRDLFEHDSLVIARILAEPLAKADETGRLLLSYIKRLTRYPCDEAIDYMVDYAKKNGYLSTKENLELKVRRVWGFFRYRASRLVRRVLLWIKG